MVAMSKKMVVLCLTVVLCLGFSLVAQAAENPENSLMLGQSWLLSMVEYERQIGESWTTYLGYGSSLAFSNENCPGYGLGARWYFKDNVMDGGYIGLGYSHTDFHGEFFGIIDIEGDVEDYLTLELGYKKVFDSGFTFAAGLQYIQYQNQEPEINDNTAGFSLAIGYSW